MFVAALMLSMAITSQGSGDRWVTIRHEGLEFQVWGHPRPDGNISWNHELPENRKSWDAARTQAAPHAPAGQIPNYGVAHEKLLSSQPDTYSAHSPAAKRFVAEALAQDRSDDATKIHLTVIGTETECNAVLRQLDSTPELARLKSRFSIQSYRPEEWSVDSKIGFQPGKPAIYLQVGRRVAWRALDNPGPQAMAAGITDALRKADPSYDPTIDPGPATHKSDGCPLGFNREHWPWILLVAGSVAVIFGVSPRKAKP